MRADQNEQYAQGTDTLSKTIMYMQGFFVKATPIVGKQICVWVIWLFMKTDFIFDKLVQRGELPWKELGALGEV